MEDGGGEEGSKKGRVARVSDLYMEHGCELWSTGEAERVL